MSPTVIVIAAGEMGSAVGHVLVQGGARVLTSLAGRSDASKARAARAGLIAVDDETRLVAEADYLLSIVPPGSALDFARRMAPALRAANRKPVFVDCNAISPETMAAVAREMAAVDCPVVDASIIGPPPRAGESRTRFYASGKPARDFARLRDYGLDIRVLDDAIGTASALKLAYASMTKGFTALGAIGLLAAERAGVADFLRAELAESRPEFVKYFGRQLPDMLPKAYRWVAEMQEVAAFLDEPPKADAPAGLKGDPAGAAAFRGVAALYRRIAADLDGPEVAALRDFIAKLG